MIEYLLVKIRYICFRLIFNKSKENNWITNKILFEFKNLKKKSLGWAVLYLFCYWCRWQILLSCPVDSEEDSKIKNAAIRSTKPNLPGWELIILIDRDESTMNTFKELEMIACAVNFRQYFLTNKHWLPQWAVERQEIENGPV